MCEWLSCREFCDVYLQCSGHVFSAHRAVLASVSNFLKEVLLSCPAEETPIMIVLPEFDHDSVSSMLYYIYNGEVVIKESQIKNFLEIINAMQIFLDSQYLTNITDLVKSHNVNTSCQYLDFQSSARLVQGDNDNNEYINLSTTVNFQKVFELSKDSFQYKHANKNIAQNKRGLNKNFSDYLKSVHEYRQRQSFSRGLFIETSSLNGNSNGKTNNVMAITNECYRKPTSPHLTNANSEYLDTNNLLTQSSFMEVSENISKFKLNQQHIKKYDMFCVKNWCEISRFHNYNETQIDVNFLCKRRTFNEIKEVEGRGWMLTRKPAKVEEIKEGYINVYYPNILLNKKTLTGIKEHRIQESSHLIHNEVLQSPWRSKVPNNYKPSHKNTHNGSTCGKTDFNCKANTTPETYKNNNSASTITSTSNICMEAGKADADSCEYLNCFNFADKEHNSHVKQCVRYKCVECHKSFSQLRNYKYHMSVHRGTKEFAATCPICGKHFNDKGYLSSHLKIHRNRKEYKCSICPKSFNQRVAYNMHMRTHTGEKPHVCEECGKAFSRKMLLKQHFRTHSGERPYACSHCDKRFADRSNMILHLRLHSGIKPFKCSLCPKSFTKKHHLKSHLNFHTGDKPYSCPRCNLAFTQSSNMRTHYKKCNMVLQL